MAKRTAILVTGSRDWIDPGPIRDRLRLYPEGSILIHGDCGKLGWANGRRAIIGADWIARDIAGPCGFIVWPLPYFDHLERPGGPRLGGPRRNECMFAVLKSFIPFSFDLFVEAFPIGKSPGTRGMIRMVKAYNDAAFYDDAKTQKHHDPIPLCVTEGAVDG